MSSFAPEQLAVLAQTLEVQIVTGSSPKEHRTIIWVVVDDHDRVFVRSVNGSSARWYREVRADPDVALLVGTERFAVRAEPAADAERIAACSTALRSKYRGPSLDSMLRDHTLETTLELVPR